ncbi:MAG: MotA/TolQ/ExbB proton channel family protein [Verrucomicrobia bacterium]|nr:MotA/TolQ/ExbB proton channel family protein [Verrucomicrobiota bacterium]
MLINLLQASFNMPLAGVLTYFAQSNTAGKVIVLLLVAFSFLAWTVMFGKRMDLARMRTQNLKFANRLGATDSVLVIDPALPKALGPYAELTRNALTAYHNAKSSPHAVSHAENALQRAVTNISLQYESRMVVLGSIVSGAPFLGLLGTVWGVMDAFGAISTDSTASIGALAPGVSGALLTTVAGLLVAIPSVFGYNFLLTQTKLMITELENFASSLADRIEIERAQQNDHGA